MRGGRPAGAVGGDLALDRVALGVLDLDRGQLALGGADLERAAGVDGLRAVLGRDRHDRLRLLVSRGGGRRLPFRLPSSAPESEPPPPPHAVTATAAHAERAVPAGPLAPPRSRPAVPPAEAPDIGRAFTVFLPSPGPDSGPLPRARHTRATGRILTHKVEHSLAANVTVQVPTRSVVRDEVTGSAAPDCRPVAVTSRRRPPSTPSSPCSSRRARCRERPVLSLLWTTSTTSPTRLRSKNQPAGVSELPPFTSLSPTQPWLTLVRAEGVRAPSSCRAGRCRSWSAASRAGRPGCRTRRRSRRCAPFIRVTLVASPVTTIFPLYVVVLGAPGRDRHGGEQLAVAPYLHGVRGGVDQRRPGCGRR